MPSSGGGGWWNRPWSAWVTVLPGALKVLCRFVPWPLCCVWLGPKCIFAFLYSDRGVCGVTGVHNHCWVVFFEFNPLGTKCKALVVSCSESRAWLVSLKNPCIKYDIIRTDSAQSCTLHLHLHNKYSFPYNHSVNFITLPFQQGESEWALST